MKTLLPTKLFRAHHLLGACAVAACLALASPGASADEYDEAMRLADSKQYAGALERINRYLQKQPGEPQMRFLKGIVETDAGKTDEAIATFTKLTQDYPAIAEAYNNLAMLYASKAQYDKALLALETAVRTKPNYSRAQENLGDVHARLATMAYAKALSVGGAEIAPSVQPKLDLVGEIFEERKRPAPSKARGPGGTAGPGMVVAQASGSGANTGNGASNVQAGSSPSKALPAAQSAPLDAARQTSIIVDVESAVKSWANAWQSKNVDAYLASYAPQFVPAGNAPRQAWEAERRSRITGKSRIEVRIEDLKISVNGSTATASFTQRYSADALSQTNRKILSLVKTADDRWLIAREVS